MNKDVIYIDVEDDITAIISKVKDSKEKIVALVPPKRVGVLQSAVNLRLLQRSAEQSDKRLVLITNNHALMGLAASAKLPVARNLQSKPEIAEVAALEVDDGEDVIDGNELPIGEHAGLKDDDGDSAKALAAAPAISGVSLATPPKAGASAVKPKSGVKVPNFNTFRKKMMLGIGLGVAALLFLVWAIFFAQNATIVVSAKTNDSSVNDDVRIGDKLRTSVEQNTIKAEQASVSQEKSVDFTPTGRKNIGEKASGTVNYTNNSQSSVTVPNGTSLKTSDGKVFVTTESVTIPGGTISCSPFPNCNGVPGSASGGASASEGGADYNNASGSLSGAPSNVEAEFDGPTSGGTDKIVKVVTAADVQRAKEALVKEEDDDMKQTLRDKFKEEVKIVNESYGLEYKDVSSSPDVGADASSGTAVLTATVVYKIYGVPTKELDTYLDDYFKEALKDSDDQRVYDNGRKKANFQDVETDDDTVKLTLIATGKIGPKLDENEIKELSKGKEFGDIQEAIQGIPGVEDVDVRYSVPWMSSVPQDKNKISVRFEVNE